MSTTSKELKKRRVTGKVKTTKKRKIYTEEVQLTAEDTLPNAVPPAATTTPSSDLEVQLDDNFELDMESPTE